MNVSPAGSLPLDNALKPGTPADAQAVLSKSGLVSLVMEKLSFIKLHHGRKAEKQSVKALYERLISEYPGAATNGEPPCITRALDESHKDFLKRFILEVITQYPLLKFQEVNSRDEAEQSSHNLTQFYDTVNCVDIKICKISEVIESVKILVSMYKYPWIDHLRKDQHKWGEYSGLLNGDLFISAGSADVVDLSHKRVMKRLKKANARTSYSPLFFFRNEDSLQKGMLIICRSTHPVTPKGKWVYSFDLSSRSHK
ncbi:hypothetical protein [Endozoicomonas sp. GU-1]|uniref:hypothetical protein n=1 Tax=Endozoicomonas sp. GU-1 TaxID=3009078 RepID=UPI0022B2FBFA|nr:hypothetical protein [Endozoicomonas sp. GU-1]WBA83792.1 hypothetical protein O2T12_12060 [Endozoicomonas sp. GU-1]WBA86771.1 hypothetical protein O3276_01620 [Endozoicomonas sp. GU-1]